MRTSRVVVSECIDVVVEREMQRPRARYCRALLQCQDHSILIGFDMTSSAQAGCQALYVPLYSQTITRRSDGLYRVQKLEHGMYYTLYSHVQRRQAGAIEHNKTLRAIVHI